MEFVKSVKRDEDRLISQTWSRLVEELDVS